MTLDTDSAITTDDLEAKLLQIIPDAQRFSAEPMLRGYLGLIRAQQGEEGYRAYLLDMKTGMDAYRAGEREKAASILSQYGLDLSLIESMYGASQPPV